jgi:hypothetical protein
MKGAAWCFKHHPELGMSRLVASVKGGRHRKRPDVEPAAPTALRSIEDAVTELEHLADEAKRLHHGSDRIRTLLAIVRASIDAHTDHLLERRIAAIEERTERAPHLKRA